MRSLPSIRFCLLVLASALLSPACNHDASPTGTRLPAGPVEVADLFDTGSSGIEQRQRRVVRDAVEFENLWNAIIAAHQVPAPLPPVDFDRDMVLLVTKGTSPDSCNSIRVASASSDGRQLSVTVVEEESDLTCTCLAVLAEPAALVRVPRAGDVVFATITRSSCSQAS